MGYILAASQKFKSPPPLHCKTSRTTSIIFEDKNMPRNRPMRLRQFASNFPNNLQIRKYGTYIYIVSSCSANMSSGTIFQAWFETISLQ